MVVANLHEVNLGRGMIYTSLTPEPVEKVLEKVFTHPIYGKYASELEWVRTRQVVLNANTGENKSHPVSKFLP